jgi:trehalose 6-phosphate phosphatase
MNKILTARLPALGPMLAEPPVPRLAQIALFADLDGTLASLEATPDAVGPDPRRRDLLDALRLKLDGRLAVVSGRGMEDLDRVLEGRIPALGAVHGLVRRRADGVVVTAPGAVGMGEALDALKVFAKADRSLLVENKGGAVALHYRGNPTSGAACRDLARRLSGPLGLTVLEGDMVVELRTPGPDKGAAVAAFMQEAPFAGFTPVFLGDDLTDEDGFRAAQALGGYGVIVGSRRPTEALFALESVDKAREWLGAAVTAAS